MNDHSERSTCPEWDPLTPDVIADQRRVHDDLRGRCPIAHSDLLGWSVLRHADAASVGIVVTYLADHPEIEAQLDDAAGER